MGAVTTVVESIAMGGDAFPDTRWLSEEEYERMCDLISGFLGTRGLQFSIPVEVADKAEICRARGKTQPYGDVDVIVARSPELEASELVREIMELVGGRKEEILKNDSTYSFLSKERYQIDVKFCDESKIEFLTAFKSNNDFGALLGHLLTPLQLKWSDSGLMLKLRRENVSGVGAVRADFQLTNNLDQVCNFVSIPRYSLDCETRLSCRNIYDILTTCRAFFPNDYDEKYKIKERRKKRPVSDSFFNYLENENLEDLAAKKNEIFEDDEIERLFRTFRDGELSSEKYINKIADIFNKKGELEEKIQQMEARLAPASLDPKFNHLVLGSWYPELGPNELGRLFGKLKSRHSGPGPESWSRWIEGTEIINIKQEAEQCRRMFVK